MAKGFFTLPEAKNEAVKLYRPQSPERIELQSMLHELRSAEIEIPMVIGGKKVFTADRVRMFPPHEIKHTLGHYSQGDSTHLAMAIDAALAARPRWSQLPWQHRASIFLKAAELISGPFRSKINAATMLGQSKNAYQSEIDAACELADFFRFGVKYMAEIYEMQPGSSPGIWNYNEYRPLEGFVFALTPFNFTSIAGNLPSAPAMMGNVCIWKPSKNAVYSASVIMEVLMEAGIPDGVINMVFVPGAVASEVLLSHRDFAGIHFTGSTPVFHGIWKKIGENIDRYKSYPRIVGETGGKDFIFADPTCDVTELVTAFVRGAFEFQGQKCSAVSRAYIPQSVWPIFWKETETILSHLKIGPPEDFTNFINAVIDEDSFDKLKRYIDNAKTDSDVEMVYGGKCDKSIGYFIEPTVIVTKNPGYVTMREELFGPIVTVYVYDDNQLDETLDMVDNTSPYALTGAVFSQNRNSISKISERLVDCAGNFYINDKPTGAVVGQQPFGGGRASGTNDKAGSAFNLLRWVNIRTVKENFLPPKNVLYPSFEPDVD